MSKSNGSKWLLQIQYVSLQAEYADNPLTWDYMARQELELGSLKSTEPTTKQAKVSEMTQREERCCAVFEEAVTAVPTGEMFFLLFQHTVCCESFEGGCQQLWVLDPFWGSLLYVNLIIFKGTFGLERVA